MSKKLAVCFAIVVLLSFAGMIHAQAPMTNYCLQPPFTARVLKPNVLILMDNSGSMGEKAIVSAWAPATTWYGYFDSTRWYAYNTGTSRFEDAGDKATVTKQLTFWDGNFLNWMTMRRIDIVKKVLIGGKTTGRTGAGNPHTLVGDGDQGAYGPASISITNAGNVADQTTSETGAGPNLTNQSNNVSPATSMLGCTFTIPGSQATSPVTLTWNLTDNPSSAASRTDCVRIQLRKVSSGTTTMVKDYGVANTNTFNATTFYTTNGAGQYQLLFEERNSTTPACNTISGITHTASISAISMTVNGSFATSATRSFQLLAGTTPATTPSRIQLDGIASCSAAVTKNVAVLVNTEPTGIYQATDPDIRYGLEFYNAQDGGKIMSKVQDTNPASFLTTIEAEHPGDFTPLAESLWTGIGYFAQNNTSSTDGPRYSSVPSYTVDSCNDPFNFNNGISSTASVCDAAKVMVPCAKSFILAVTDGEPTYDMNLPTAIDNVSGTYAGTCSAGSGTGGCTVTGSGSTAISSCCIDNVTLYGHWNPGVGERDLRSDLTGDQSVGSYLVFASFGSGGSSLLNAAGRNGGFDDSDGNNVPNLTTEWDTDGDGNADNFFVANNGQQLEAALTQALNDILKRAGSATANSVIGAGKGQGSNILQAFFFPRKDIGTADVTWAGFLHGLWFQVDPLLGFADIREDSCSGANCSGDDVLNTINDKIATFIFDPVLGEATVRRFNDTDGDGLANGAAIVPDISLLELKSIWEAGIELFNRTPASRTIFTNLDGTSLPAGISGLPNFAAGGTIPFAVLQAPNTSEADKIINYVRGTDISGTRPRTTTINIGGTNVTNTWKLADIIDSTAQIEGAVPLNDYHRPEVYNDNTYRQYINSLDYQNRNFAYAGANDGMFHAFFVGKLNRVDDPSGRPHDVAEMTDPDSLGLGKEQWAFIPRNALPYLRYLMDKNYCHLYYVNNPPMLFDASISDDSEDGSSYFDVTKSTVLDSSDNHIISSTWRTIVIGSMGLGGGCGCSGAGCTTSPFAANTPPEGLSSYFALDVTDPSNPVLLWEFSNPELGFSTAQPAIVKISALDSNGDPDKTKNGHWFVVIGSGPTGDVETLSHQFRGKSVQTLKYFVLDLKDGSLKRTITPNDISGNPFVHAFSGALGGVVDSDKDYQDEVIYGGLVRESSSGSGLWTQGSVLRIVTHEDSNPNNWTTSTLVHNVGAVPTKVTSLLSSIGPTKQLWLYFGTGRYYFKDSSANIDDSDTQRRLFGIKEPIFDTDTNKINPTLTDTVVVGTSGVPPDLFDATTDAFSGDTTASGPGGYPGFFINLDIPASASALDKAERVITDPDISTLGVVFFTTFAPSSNPCTFGGKTFIWALRYDTGGSGAGFLYGFALIQTSTGAIEQQQLSSAFTEKTAGNETSAGFGRRTAAFLGQPPREGALTVLTPPPFKTILRIKEQ